MEIKLITADTVVKEYKAYADDLYKIKISTLPKGFKETRMSLINFLDEIGTLRPHLRKSLNELASEFKQKHKRKLTLEYLKRIEEINNTTMEKLYVLAYQVKKKIDPL